MMGIAGNVLISLAFLASVLALISYYLAETKKDDFFLKLGNWSFTAKTALIALASIVLIKLLLDHAFNYFYVFNYTSKDLPLRYLISAFWGGQEGSFMLWILLTGLIGIGLMRWSPPQYRASVLFFMTLTQVALTSMILGWDLFGLKIGASPFRTLAQEMPDAPFLAANPNFVPQDGKGLNDLLRSPWMMIHPPILFLGFSMMTVPFSFALASLWTRDYHEWIKPALPWNLAANLCMWIAIFLGGYWAYVTLSFGGYWAWDPVENASLVPWIIGTAGIHSMLITRKSNLGHRSAIFLPILAYLGVVYETFLTRSGVLEDASVHSFVDLGLYNQLLIFMVGSLAVSLVLYARRFNELPTQEKEAPVFSREFFMILGILSLSLLGLVIILGTSSPILGKLFVANPTPPQISFYNEWTLPIAIAMAVLTALGQYLWWQKHTVDSLSKAVLLPLILASLTSVALIILMELRNPAYMALMLSAAFALFGNGALFIELAKKRSKLVGGLVSHLGFAVLLIGVLLSSAKSRHLLDAETERYNDAVEQGLVKDENGFTIQQGVNMVKLERDVPKAIDGRYLVTYTNMEMGNIDRQGEQRYSLKFEPIDGNGYTYTLAPVIYPMNSGMGGSVNWGVDPEVRAGLLSDIYLYVAGSSYIERINEEVSVMQPASVQEGDVPRYRIKRGATIQIDDYSLKFQGFEPLGDEEIPDSAIVSVKAHLDLSTSEGQTFTLKPVYAVVREGGEKYGYNSPVKVPELGLEIRFNNVNPSTDEIELIILGLKSQWAGEDWVLIVAEEKPLISFVWLGVFLLMIGFSIAIMRRWDETRLKRALA